MPKVRPAEGTTIEIGDQAGTDGTVYTELAQVVSITPPGGNVASVETTNLKSSAKRFRPGKIPDFGQVSFRIQYDPNETNHQTLATLLATPGIRNFRVTYVTGNTVSDANDTFDAFIESATPAALEDETNLEWDLTLKIDGVVTRNAGSDV